MNNVNNQQGYAECRYFGKM